MLPEPMIAAGHGSILMKLPPDWCGPARGPGWLRVRWSPARVAPSARGRPSSRRRRRATARPRQPSAGPATTRPGRGDPDRLRRSPTDTVVPSTSSDMPTSRRLDRSGSDRPGAQHEHAARCVVGDGVEDRDVPSGDARSDHLDRRQHVVHGGDQLTDRRHPDEGRHEPAPPQPRPRHAAEASPRLGPALRRRGTCRPATRRSRARSTPSWRCTAADVSPILRPTIRRPSPTQQPVTRLLDRVRGGDPTGCELVPQRSDGLAAGIGAQQPVREPADHRVIDAGPIASGTPLASRRHERVLSSY